VKAAGFWDVLIYNLGLISIGIGVLYIQRFGNGYYPNADIAISVFIAAIIMFFVLMAFWCWSTVIPRSGGIYVFLTRAGWPSVGFSLSFVECVSWLFYVAIAIKLFVVAGLIPAAISYTGLHSELTLWLQNPIVELVAGSIILWAAVILLISGTRRYLLAQRFVFIVAIIGTAAALVVLTDQNAGLLFQANLDDMMRLDLGVSNYYHLAIDQAKAAGWVASEHHTIASAFGFSVWPFLPLIGAAFSIGIGGEIRNTTRNQLFGMLGSLVVAGALFVAIAWAASGGIGDSIQGALAYNYDNAVNIEGKPLGFEPYFTLLAMLATNNHFLRICIVIGFLCWIWFWIPGVLAYTERALLAWSLDRAAPAALANLHPRYSTPYVSVLVSGFVAQLFLALVLFSDTIATLVFILAATAAWTVTLVLGIFFPYMRSSMYQASSVAHVRLSAFP
jgi:amino acid transporter